jgi:hypothetical protein
MLGMSLPLRSLPTCAIWLTLLLATGLASPVVWADGEKDHDRARQAVQAGEVLPLKEVLARLEREYPGQVLALELEREHGQWVYEVKLLQSGGRLVKLELDARSGEVIKRRDRPGGSAP